MKYYLATSGKKGCCNCTWRLKLAQNEDGYDLIQIKRGYNSDIKGMKLQPGEPAIVFDTGAFYIGGSDGTPMLINKSSVSADSAVLIVINSQLDTGLVVIPYGDMYAPDGTHPTAGDVSLYSAILVCNDDRKPLGIASVQKWSYSDTEAQVYYTAFSDAAMDLVPFTDADLDAIIAHAEAQVG